MAMNDYRDKVASLVEDGWLDWETVGRELLNWVSMDTAQELYEQFADYMALENE
jgi:hypothetical protein